MAAAIPSQTGTLTKAIDRTGISSYEKDRAVGYAPHTGESAKWYAETAIPYLLKKCLHGPELTGKIPLFEAFGCGAVEALATGCPVGAYIFARIDLCEEKVLR